MIHNGFLKVCDGVWVNKNHVHSFTVQEEKEDPGRWSISVIVIHASPKKDPRVWSLQDSFTTREEANKALDSIIMQGELND